MYRFEWDLKKKNRKSIFPNYRKLVNIWFKIHKMKTKLYFFINKLGIKLKDYT